jgi:hypothetical protein
VHPTPSVEAFFETLDMMSPTVVFVLRLGDQARRSSHRDAKSARLAVSSRREEASQEVRARELSADRTTH